MEILFGTTLGWRSGISINSLTNFACGHTGAQLKTPRNAKNQIDCSKLSSKMVHYLSAFTVMLKTTCCLTAFFFKRARNFVSQSGSVSANSQVPLPGVLSEQQQPSFQADKLQLNVQGNDDQVLECRGGIIGEYPIYQTPTNLLRN